MSEALWDLIGAARVVDLSQPLEVGIPVSPNHPGFNMALLRRHGDKVREDGGSGANEMIVFGGHTGTHIDAHAHVSQDGVLHGGIDAHAAQCGGRLSAGGVETIPIAFCRGVLLDVAGLHGVAHLDAGAAVTAEDLERAARRQHVAVEPGDAVLVRTGWSERWSEPQAFVGWTDGAPGVDESGAQWLIDRRIRLTGSDTLAYEQIPAGKGHARLPVHRMLLVEHGANIVEMLQLSELAALGAAEFLFVLTPLKVVGATGVPVRPVAVLP